MIGNLRMHGNSSAGALMVTSESNNIYGEIIVQKRSGRSIFIPCPFMYSRIWNIRGLVYSLSNLPSPYAQHYVGIEIPGEAVIRNETKFYCLMSTGTNFDVITGPRTVLHVIDGMFR